MLLTIPFVVDLAGNALDLYDQVSWFDDAGHLVNWALLSRGVRVRRLVGGRGRSPDLGGLRAGARVRGRERGPVGIGEYGAFILDTPESVTAYRDTIGDLAPRSERLVPGRASRGVGHAA